MAFSIILAGAAPALLAQPVLPAPPAPAPAPSAAVQAGRLLEVCNSELQRGVVSLGCQGPLYRNELERLKQEALTTQNPQLLSLVGEAYENQRSGLGDVSQAYRWYLLAAVRGDPRAMQRLAELNRKGQGTTKDNVKALGYARLAERMARPGAAATPGGVTSIISELGTEMAAEEMVLAERFAAELQARIQRQSGAAPAAGDAAAGMPAPASGVVPGLHSPATTPPPDRPPLPGTTLPGVPQR